MRFRTSKIARGKKLFEKSPFPSLPRTAIRGTPIRKNFNIWVLTMVESGWYREQPSLKSPWLRGSGTPRLSKRGLPEFLLS